MVDIPVGDVVRDVAKKKGWPGWIQAALAFVKGIRIPIGRTGVNIALDQKQGPASFASLGDSARQAKRERFEKSKADKYGRGF